MRLNTADLPMRFSTLTPRPRRSQSNRTLAPPLESEPEMDVDADEPVPPPWLAWRNRIVWGLRAITAIVIALPLLTIATVQLHNDAGVPGFTTGHTVGSLAATCIDNVVPLAIIAMAASLLASALRWRDGGWWHGLTMIAVSIWITWMVLR